MEKPIPLVPGQSTLVDYGSHSRIRPSDRVPFLVEHDFHPGGRLVHKPGRPRLIHLMHLHGWGSPYDYVG